MAWMQPFLVDIEDDSNAWLPGICKAMQLGCSVANISPGPSGDVVRTLQISSFIGQTVVKHGPRISKYIQRLCQGCRNGTKIHLPPLVSVSSQAADLHVVLQRVNGKPTLNLAVEFENGEFVFVSMANSHASKTCCSDKGFTAPDMTNEPPEYEKRVTYPHAVTTSSDKLSEIAINNSMNFKRYTGSLNQHLEWLKPFLKDISDNPRSLKTWILGICKGIQFGASVSSWLPKPSGTILRTLETPAVVMEAAANSLLSEEVKGEVSGGWEIIEESQTATDET